MRLGGLGHERLHDSAEQAKLQPFRADTDHQPVQSSIPHETIGPRLFANKCLHTPHDVSSFRCNRIISSSDEHSTTTCASFLVCLHGDFRMPSLFIFCGKRDYHVFYISPNSLRTESGFSHLLNNDRDYFESLCREYWWPTAIVSLSGH